MGEDKLVGIIPAGGYGTRMAPFKLWKELIPIGYKKIEGLDNSPLIPKVISEYILEEMVSIGTDQVVMVLNEQKHEIFRFFGNGEDYNTNIIYTSQSKKLKVTGMPVAIDSAYTWIKGKTVVMGMPDTIVEPQGYLKELYAFHRDKKSDLTLGIFPTKCPERLAPVLLDEKTNRVLDIYDKPKHTTIYNTWGVCIWSRRFTELLHEYVQENRDSDQKELLLSNIFLEAMKDKLEVYGLQINDGIYHDFGDINQFVATKSSFEKYGV